MKDQMACGRVGVVVEGVGGEGPLRLGRYRDLVVSQAHGRFSEATQNRSMYYVSTAVAGVAPGTAFSTTPPMAIWNPPNSGVLIAIAQVFLGYVSGTLGAGFMGHGYTPGQNTAPTAGAELQPTQALLSQGQGKARAFQGSTLVVAPALIRPSFSMGPALATTAQFPFLPYDEVDGAIQIAPGAVWAFQGAALGAGTTPLVVIGVSYEELPLPI